MALFESYERRIKQIDAVLNSYGIASIEEAEKITKDAGLDVYKMVEGIQPICFENAKWAYTDSTLSCCEGLVASQECEALSLLFQKHLAQISMSQTYLTGI